MSRFINKKPIRISLNKDEWVEVKKPSYEEFTQLSEGLKEDDRKTQMEFGIKLLRQTIVNWNFRDEEGNEVPFDKSLINDLDVPTIAELTEKIQSIILPEKKS